MAIIITGASRGIGRSIALKLSQQGYGVAINYHSSESAAIEVREACRSVGVRAEIYQADVSDYQACADMIQAVNADLGKIEGLVNNAGLIRDALLLKMSAADFDRVLAVNLKGVFNCCQAAAKIMIAQKQGSIVNISSISGLHGNVGQVNYAAAKAGIVGLTKALALELARYNIRINAIAPGFIRTQMTEGMAGKIMDKLIQRIPMRRMGNPEDIASVVSFLLSKDSAYMTGQVLTVDGGMHI